jgi:hypothetical protein
MVAAIALEEHAHPAGTAEFPKHLTAPDQTGRDLRIELRGLGPGYFVTPHQMPVLGLRCPKSEMSQSSTR